MMEKENIEQLKKQALEKLLEDCRGEFCYGDPRVQKYKEHYLILGEDFIDRIHDVYLAWLKENCTTFAQDAQSGEFTGIAIDWHGKEDQQPDFWGYLISGEIPTVPEVKKPKPIERGEDGMTAFERTIKAFFDKQKEFEFTCDNGYGYAFKRKFRVLRCDCKQGIYELLGGRQRNVITFDFVQDDNPYEQWEFVWEHEDYYEVYFDNFCIIKIDKDTGQTTSTSVDNENLPELPHGPVEKIIPKETIDNFIAYIYSGACFMNCTDENHRREVINCWVKHIGKRYKVEEYVCNDGAHALSFEAPCVNVKKGKFYNFDTNQKWKGCYFPDHKHFWISIDWHTWHKYDVCL